MIEIKNINFSYKKNNLLFDNMQTKFERGHVYGLLGVNGAGKTTMLKLMSGLRFPDRGSIMINNELSTNRSAKMLMNLFFLPEVLSFPNLSVEKYVKLYSSFYPNFNSDNFFNMLTEFKVERSSKINKLSYGQKKKMLISFGLSTKTDILLADEPTNGLDIPSRRAFKKLISGTVDENNIVIISTHQIADIENIIDAVVILDKGKIALNCTFEEINKKLIFTTRDTDNGTDILYARKTFNNYEVIAKNTTKQHSNINMELLFEAATSQNSNKFIEQFA